MNYNSISGLFSFKWSGGLGYERQELARPLLGGAEGRKTAYSNEAEIDPHGQSGE